MKSVIVDSIRLKEPRRMFSRSDSGIGYWIDERWGTLSWQSRLPTAAGSCSFSPPAEQITILGNKDEIPISYVE